MSRPLEGLSLASGGFAGGEGPSELRQSEEEEEELEVQSDDEELADVEETLQERLVGLTEMVPARVWKVAIRTLTFSYWLLRRSAWVLGSSVALLALPPFIEQQRMELEEMHNLQKKQLMLGQNPAVMPPSGPRPM